MGTSKSYITPRTKPNTAAKRGLTSYIHGGSVSLAKAVGRFAAAVTADNRAGATTDHSTGSFIHYGKKIGKVLGFISGAPAFGGILQFINEKYPENPPQSPNELFLRLLDEDTAIGTLDDAVVRKAFSITIETLCIVNFEQLDQMDLSVFAKELLANLAMTCFEQRYAVQIQSKANTLSQAQSKLEEFKRFIHNDIIANADTSDIVQCIANHNDLSAYVESKCVEIFSILEKYI